MNLWLYVFLPHRAAEADRLSYLKPATIRNIDGLWPRPWLYSRVLLLFALAFAVLYWIWSLEGRGESSTLMPGLSVVGALGVPLSMAVFFFECNKFRTIPLLRVFQFMLIGSVVAIAITFLLTLAFDRGLDSSYAYPSKYAAQLSIIGRYPNVAMAITALIEEFGKTLLIFIFLMRYSRKCYILQGMLIGAAVGAGFAVFETAGYASTGSDMLLQSEIERSLMAPACHTAWGAIIGAGTMMIARGRLRWRMLVNPKFSLLFFAVAALHFLWNMSLDHSDTLLRNVQLGIITIFVLLAMMWAGVGQVRQFIRQGYLPIAQR